MRPIDADALEGRMYHDAFETDSDMQRWDSGRWIRYKMFENAINDMPTIEERKTGRWLTSDDLYETGICSCCKYDSQEPVSYAVTNFHYCPHYGARMDGGDDSE